MGWDWWLLLRCAASEGQGRYSSTACSRHDRPDVTISCVYIADACVSSHTGAATGSWPVVCNETRDSEWLGGTNFIVNYVGDFTHQFLIDFGRKRDWMSVGLTHFHVTQVHNVWLRRFAGSLMAVCSCRCSHAINVTAWRTFSTTWRTSRNSWRWAEFGLSPRYARILQLALHVYVPNRTFDFA